MTNKTKSALTTFIIVIMAIAMCFAGCKNAPKIDANFIYQQELKEDGTYELIAYPKNKWIVSKATSYQFNIIHMTDSIKVYDGSRYVGQCAEKDLETLIINDNQ